MYSFKKMKKATGTETVQLPSVAINFNGKQLDTEIEAFQTLKVSGRETISVELETVDVRNGSLILDERLPHRELLVTYLMSSKSNTAFQSDYKALRKLLTSDDETPITFKDEPNTVYFGRLADFETVDDDSNTVISTFKIICSSPFKYSNAVTTTGAVTVDTFYPTQPDSITLTIGATTNKIKITHNGYNISATGTFNAGAKVVLKFNKENMTMEVNGTDATYMIDLNSDFENFQLKKNNSVTSAQGTISLVARERWL